MHNPKTLPPADTAGDQSGRDDTEAAFAASLAIDLERARRLQRPFRQAAEVLAHVSEGALLTALDGTILWTNTAVCRITGHPQSELVGATPARFRSGRHDDQFYARMWAAIATEGSWRGEIWNRRATGEVFPEWLTISTLRSTNGTPAGYIAVFSDLTSLRDSEDALQHIAHHDPLTGLPNRTLLLDRLRHAIEHARRRQEQFSILFVDLDRFKPINDSLGHEAGDVVLRSLAERLSTRLRHADTIARFGGDEFVVVLDPDPDENSAAQVALDIVRLLGEPVDVDAHHRAAVGASIGIARYPDDGRHVSELLQHADTAMYSAKEAGGGTWRFYRKALTEAARRRLRIQEGLRRAVDEQTLTAHYLPLYCTDGARIMAVEAVARWTHPELGSIPPAEFLPIAAQTQLIRRVGALVRSLAFPAIASLQRASETPLDLILNMHQRELADPDCVPHLVYLSREHEVALDRIVIDVREEALLRDARQVAPQLHSLAERGVRFVIDDFGTGHLSLANLLRLPIHGLKVDRTIVRKLPADADAKTLCSLAAEIARRLNIAIIAEGVETSTQLDSVAELGFQAWQGFLGTAALPLSSVHPLLPGNRSPQPEP